MPNAPVPDARGGRMTDEHLTPEALRAWCEIEAHRLRTGVEYRHERYHPNVSPCSACEESPDYRNAQRFAALARGQERADRMEDAIATFVDAWDAQDGTSASAAVLNCIADLRS